MNINATILDPVGRSIFSFGGSTAWKTISYRGYIVSLEWFVGAKSCEPMMVIQDQKQGHEHGAFGICLSSIGRYADQSGGASPGALQACHAALDTLGKASLVIEAKALLDLILHFASDLIKMPVMPSAARRDEAVAPVIEIELKNEYTGKTEREASI